MNDAINQAHKSILAIESEKDSVEYRMAWGLSLPGDVMYSELDFEDNIEDRLYSVVADFARNSNQSWESANDALILHRIENR